MLALAAGSAVTGHLAMGGWTRPSEPVRTARLVRSCAAVPLPLRSLAAAAGPSRHASGEAMLQGSKALICQAAALGAGPTAAHAEGGRRLGDAGKELEVAGSSLCDAGAALEEGRRPLG